MKKKIKVILAVVCAICCFTGGALASNGLVDIAAKLNYNISVAKDGQVQTLRDAQGNVVIPISYNDSTYLPVRAISNLLGHSVDWDDNTKCVLLDGSPVPASLIGSTPSTPSTGNNDALLSGSLSLPGSWTVSVDSINETEYRNPNEKQYSKVYEITLTITNNTSSDLSFIPHSVLDLSNTNVIGALYVNQSRSTNDVQSVNANMTKTALSASL